MNGERPLLHRIPTNRCKRNEGVRMSAREDKINV